MLNNSQDMKTVVETFFVEEVTNLIHDADALQKWEDLSSFLELSGQKKIQVTEKSPIPFLWMNTALLSVFETLCPCKVNVEAYDKMPIPLEVLELIALSKRESYFDHIIIRYDDKTPDPVCIGYKVPDEHKSKDRWYQEFYAEKYLIARWSDVKASFAELTERAIDRFKRSRVSELKKSIKDAQRSLEDIDIEIEAKFGSAIGNVELPF